MTHRQQRQRDRQWLQRHGMHDPRAYPAHDPARRAELVEPPAHGTRPAIEVDLVHLTTGFDQLVPPITAPSRDVDVESVGQQRLGMIESMVREVPRLGDEVEHRRLASCDHPIDRVGAIEHGREHEVAGDDARGTPQAPPPARPARRR